MNKILSFALAVAAVLTPLFSFAQANEGLGQLASISPTPGVIDLEVNESGFAGMNFAFKNSNFDVNRNANVCVTVKRDGKVISNVPASNYEMIKFDGIMSYVWQVAFFRTPSSEAKAGGDYQVIIPAGMFVAGDAMTPNEEIVVNYTMPVNTTTVYPEETNRAVEIQDFVVTFGSAASIELVENPAHPVTVFDLYAVITDPSDSTASDDEVEPVDFGYKPSISVSGNQLFIHLDSPVTAPGTWKLDIPEGIVSLLDSEGNKTNNPALIYQYKIPNYTLGKPTIFPAEGRTLGFPGIITLTLEKGTTVGAINNMGASKIYPVNADGTLGKAIATYRCAPNNSKYYKDPTTGATITSNLNKVFLINQNGEDNEIYPAPGMYQLVTSDMLYQIVKGADKSYISTLYFDYEVVDGGYYDMTFAPSPDEPQDKLQEVCVTFEGADEITINFAPAWFSSDTTNYLFLPSKAENDPESVVFKCNVPVTIPGTYTLTSATDCVKVDEDNVVVYAEYTIKGVESGVQECVGNVTVLPEVFDICNAQGLVVKRNANVEILRALPAGIYICAGKKIVKH